MIIPRKFYVIVVCILMLLVSCKKDNPTPKPRGYFRIDLPEKEYTTFSDDCPYKFEYPKYSKIYRDPYGDGRPCWLNINFPDFNGNIHISYKKVNNNLAEYIEDSRELAYKHSVKAEAIAEKKYVNRGDNVYGILYDLKGNVASPLQFFMTDSTDHFLRGSLYFRTVPNKDSLAPVLDFVRKDVKHMINTLEWE
jgi:gliding motility-associated lipoprotein GldD